MNAMEQSYSINDIENRTFLCLQQLLWFVRNEHKDLFLTWFIAFTFISFVRIGKMMICKLAKKCFYTESLYETVPSKEKPFQWIRYMSATLLLTLGTCNTGFKSIYLTDVKTITVHDDKKFLWVDDHGFMCTTSIYLVFINILPFCHRNQSRDPLISVLLSSWPLFL